jgi:hypothetical protein
MAKYTLELGDIIKNNVNIFDFEYPFYDPSKKTEFEQHFIDHFYFYEIGVETVGRFKHYLKVTLNEKLPYYNMLFRTALIDYEKTKNYNITETINRTNNNSNTSNGYQSSNGSSTDNNTQNNNINRVADNEHADNRNNILDSTSTKTETNDFTRDDTITENNDTTKSNVIDTNNKHVESNTPQGLLSMNDIVNNVFASKAIIDDNKNTTSDTQKDTINKTDKNTEKTEIGVVDKNQGTTTDTNNGTSKDTINETNNSNSSNENNFNNSATNSLTNNGSENENTTRTMSGSYGVITEADMLKKHIELQSTLTTIESKFFDECNDLFMQIF